MKVRKGLVSMAAAMLAVGSTAWADQASAPAAPQLDLGTTPVMADAAPEKPLQQAFDAMGLKTLPLGISIYGYVEGGYMWDFDRPSIAEGSDFHNFSVYKGRVELDAIDMTIAKDVTADGSKFDWGFHLEGGWGSDYRFIHSNGLFDTQTPQNQYDLVQAYLEANLPFMGGIVVNAGKFVALMGYETINPTGNALYSHSYAFASAIPFTETGVTAAITANPQWSFVVGFTRGWDQSIWDSNSMIDFLAQATWTPNAKTKAILTVTEGPEGPHGVGKFYQDNPSNPSDDSDWWTVGDLVATYAWNDQTTLGLGADYGDAPHGMAAQWYGAALYGSYTINPMLTANARAEWYDDNDGFTVAGVRAAYYEATLGVTVKPLPNDKIFQWLEIRPEVRYDLSDKPVLSGKHEQLTAAADVIMQY
jgi:hypothetical protein